MKMKEKRLKLFGLKDENGREIYEGDIVENKEGMKAKVCFGQYIHYIGNKESPALGVYFDGDEGFFFSKHLKPGAKLAVKVIKNDFEK